MKIVCAWCVKEGRPGSMGEKEPLADSKATYDLCAGHHPQVAAEVRGLAQAEVARVVFKDPG